MNRRGHIKKALEFAYIRHLHKYAALCTTHRINSVQFRDRDARRANFDRWEEKNSLLTRRSNEADERAALTRQKTMAGAVLLSRANVGRALMNLRTVAFSRRGERRTRGRERRRAETLGAGISFGMRKEIRPGSLVCSERLHRPTLRRDRNSDDISWRNGLAHERSTRQKVSRTHPRFSTPEREGTRGYARKIS